MSIVGGREVWPESDRRRFTDQWFDWDNEERKFAEVWEGDPVVNADNFDPGCENYPTSGRIIEFPR